MAKSNYITRAGWQALDQELKFLWKEERPKVTQAVSDAAALGDRSENAEYIYGKRRLREIDRRVRFLSKRLEVLQIVDYHPAQEGKVFFGAWVELDVARQKNNETQSEKMRKNYLSKIRCFNEYRLCKIICKKLKKPLAMCLNMSYYTHIDKDAAPSLKSSATSGRRNRNESYLQKILITKPRS